jgi:hypothetical protein
MRLFNGERRLSLKRETSDSCETRKTQVELSELEEINQYVSAEQTEQGVQLRYDFLTRGSFAVSSSLYSSKNTTRKIRISDLV